VNRVEWVGVAMRYTDGRIIAIQIDQPEGEISIKSEDVDVTDFGDLGGRFYPTGRKWAVVHLSGPVSSSWAAGADEANRRAPRAIDGGSAAILATPKAIES